MKNKLLMTTVSLLLVLGTSSPIFAANDTGKSETAQAVIPWHPENFDDCDPENTNCVVIADINYMRERADQMKSIMQGCKMCVSPKIQEGVSELKDKMKEVVAQMKAIEPIKEDKSANK